MRWKPKSPAVKLADLGLEFLDDSEDRVNEDEDVSQEEDAIDKDLAERLKGKKGSLLLVFQKGA